MATIDKTQLATGNTRTVNVQWALANGDVGTALPFSQYADKSIQVAGVFGVGGTVVLEGSNDGGLNWQTMTDVQGNLLSFSSAKLKQVTEVTMLARPNVTGGDGTTALTVSLCIRES